MTQNCLENQTQQLLGGTPPKKKEKKDTKTRNSMKPEAPISFKANSTQSRSSSVFSLLPYIGELPD